MEKEKIRVLHVIPNFGVGGAEKLVLHLMEKMNKDIFDIAALSLYPSSNTIYDEIISQKNFKVFYLNKKLGADFSMFPKILKIFKLYNPFIVHTHLYVLRYTLFPFLLARIPIGVHTIHSIPDKECEFAARFIQWAAFKFTKIIPISITPQISKKVKNTYCINSPVIFNGIPTEEFSSCRSNNIANSSKEIILLHIGRFHPAKNHNLLVKAFLLASKEVENLTLWLIGDGPLKNKIQKLVYSLELQNKIQFLGIKKNINELLSKADIFVLSSKWEALPLSLIEAMAAGKAIISTAVGGIVDIIKNYENGILLPPDNYVELAKKIVELVKNPELRKKLGENAKQFAEKNLDISITAKKYEELYISLIKSKNLKKQY